MSASTALMYFSHMVAVWSETSVQVPQLSVVIACRDAQDVLDIQLAALARQRCPVPWEVLVCDNGSTDGTVALANSWADRLPLRVVDAAGIAGAGPARNEGVRQAKGEWIGFCDADDEVGEDWLEAMCAALAEHPFVAGRFEGARLNSERTLRSRTLDQQTELQRSSEKVGLPHAGAGNLGIHRTVFQAVGGFDPAVRYLQDTDLCWRVQLAGNPLVFVPDMMIHVRLRATLRGMYRQGRNYGASQAMLERKYAGAVLHLEQETKVHATVARPGVIANEPQVADESPRVIFEDIQPPPGGASAALRARLRTVRGGARLVKFFLTNRSSLGNQVWQLGWHIGHRS
jgi:hypothetical protein